MVRLEPINDYVILKRLESSCNIGDIILPELDKQQIIRAEVIARGPGKILDTGARGPMATNPGDIVLVNVLACAPTTLPLDLEGEYLLIPEKDIVAIIRE
jgi:co-chaperonin GroES (HSP10)